MTAGELEFSDDVTWRYLEISGGGLLRIPAGVTLTLEGDYRRHLGVNIENHGTILWSHNLLELHGVTIVSDGVIEVDSQVFTALIGDGTLITEGCSEC